MCLIVFAVESHPVYPLVLAANRDEFHARPTAAAGWWDDAPDVLAGRDLRGGGTWLGVTRTGRWAAVTNYRDGLGDRAGAPSRGDLVKDYLVDNPAPEAYLSRLSARAGMYNGFNLLIGEGSAVWWLTNRWSAEPGVDVTGPIHWERVGPGVHGLSNHLLDTPWPKVERGKQSLEALLEADDQTALSAHDLLLDQTQAADDELPSTGIPLDLERALSSSFINTPDYGTRSSTGLTIDSEGVVRFAERSFASGGGFVMEQHYAFAMRRERRWRR